MYKENIIYVSVSDGDDGNPGTIDKPKATIQEAIDIAYSYIEAGLLDTAEVHVAKGTYGVNYQEGIYITMKEGVSLYGGYISNFSSSDPENYDTIIIDKSETGGIIGNFNKAIVIETVITNATILDGFTIQGGGGEYSCAIGIYDSSPTIQNNTIYGGSGSAMGLGVVTVWDSAPTIQYNTITGGSGNGDNFGISIYNGSIAFIQYNNITGGSAGKIKWDKMWERCNCHNTIQYDRGRKWY